MRRFLFGSKRRTVATVVALSLVLTTAAWAAWTLTATNVPFRSKVGQLQAVSFSAFPTGSFQGDLTPGGSVGLRVNANNPNTVALELKSASGTLTIQAENNVTCPASNFTATLNGNVPGVAVPTGSSTIIIPNAISASAALPQACQGQEITVTLPTLVYGTVGA